MGQDKRKPGPKPETIRVEGDVDWKDALKHALGKPSPAKCDHPSLSREVAGFQKTGDWVCPKSSYGKRTSSFCNLMA